MVSLFSIQVIQDHGRKYNFEHSLLTAGLLVVELLYYPRGEKTCFTSIQNWTGAAPC